MVRSFLLLSQEGEIVPDTLVLRQDSIMIDTVSLSLRKPSANAIDSKVTYNALGSRRIDMVNKRIVLVESAVVKREDLEIKADSIVVNMITNTLFAIGRVDSTGKIAGKPVFKDGSQEFEANELIYNFKTKKAYIKEIITKQDQGLLHSQFTKLLEDGTSNIAKSSYSTCEADTPHFYINLPKARVYPGEKIVSGPGNLVLEGIPLPLVIPFGFFPIQTKRAASGILIPRIGEERERGFYLSEGGYYFAINDYIDLTVKGNVYSNGSWLSTATTNYNRLYKYNGNFNFSYANNISGHVGLEDYSKSSNYRLGWIFNQDAKSSPGSRFSASVNMSSASYDRENSYVVSEHITTQRQSSVSYSKSWDGTPFNLSASMNHSQNVKNKTVSLNLPKVNFSASRLYPFKSKKSTGPSKWYQEIQFQYSAAIDNQINTYDSLLFTKEVWNDMKNGFRHEAPLSFQLRPFRNFSISPSLSYSGVMYTQKIGKNWDPDYYDSDINKVVGKVITDTTKGVFYGQALNPAISASFNPQLFGMYEFTNPDSRLQAIRHVIKPTVGFSFVPYIPGLSTDMYRTVQTDSTGNNFSEYSIFEGGIYGTPSLSGRSGNISLGLVNMLEGKIFARDDTTGKAKKVSIIDNFSMNTSYNIFADSIRWSPVVMQVRTSIIENFNISAGGNFSLYGVDKSGRTIDTYYFEQNRKLMRLTNFTTSLDFSLSDLFKKKDEEDRSSTQDNAVNPAGDLMAGPDLAHQHDQPGIKRDAFGYPEFDMPWSMSVGYTFSYYKTGSTPIFTQALSLAGDVSLTKKTSIRYTTGYDFTGKEITMTQIGISRDLHCWEMSFNWIPNGTMQSWNFTIRVKASVLGDLKYDRRKDYHDSY